MDVSKTEVSTIYANSNPNTEKAISLFKFIGELDALKHRVTLNSSEYSWSLLLSSIHEDADNIELFYRDRVEDDNTEYDAALLRVHKPEFQRCPTPERILLEWIVGDWTSFRDNISVLERIEREPEGDDLVTSKEIKATPLDLKDTLSGYNVSSIESQKTIEYFAEDETRLQTYNKWIASRDIWVKRQHTIEQTRNLFTALYKAHIDLERDSETLEMIIANGVLRDRDNDNINHPVITRRVKTRFNPVSNTITIEDADVETDLYAILFQMLANINIDSVTQLRDDLKNNDYHPLDRNDTPGFLEVLVHQLSPESLFSKEGEPNDWKCSNRLLLYLDPSFIIRKRVNGTSKAIEQIIENISKVEYIPPHLVDIISGGTIEVSDELCENTVEEQLAAVGGESVDILLSKQANREQLEIAQRIDHYNAVLVQGPPGTGKTHTIANLMGHYLAQGKSVLVTSHTKKALTVLKDQVVSGIQSLCVSVLEDSNVDMEKSIDGITDYMSKNTAHELKNQMNKVAKERRQIIDDLAATRRKLFSIINAECNCIVINGEEISPSKAAEFVSEHVDDLSYIPGKTVLYSPLPLSLRDLSDLYQSNADISMQEEPELLCGLPSPDAILSAQDFEKAWDSITDANNHILVVQNNTSWAIHYDIDRNDILFETNFGYINISMLNAEALGALQKQISDFGRIEEWMKFAAADGKKGASFKQRWVTLTDLIDQACECAERIFSEHYGRSIVFTDIEKAKDYVATFEKMKSVLSKKNKLAKIDFVLNSNFDQAINSVLINGARIQSVMDCDLVLRSIELNNLRTQCAMYWNDLLAVHGVSEFYQLDAVEPEHIANKWGPLIRRNIDWYQNDYMLLINVLDKVKFPIDTIMQNNSRDSELESTSKIFSAITYTIPTIIDVCNHVQIIRDNKHIIGNTIEVLYQGERVNSQACLDILDAIRKGDSSAYLHAYKRLESLYNKYDLLQKRKDLIQSIMAVAPQWAEAIINRSGIHGDTTVPSDIEDAWKWKQYDGILKEITSHPYDKLQADSIALSKEYRKITAKYTEKCAWYHLLSRTERDIDMKQALQGWKLTVKKIGKGTGKNAPMYKAKARELMAKCQAAVPGWIMPINKALESLDPRTNIFDIIIIDESSQSDLSAMAIAYMAKKLLVVGDDKQVSPMAVGIEVEKMNALEKMYIKGKIPNSHLYNAKTSLYDIAATTFQPLMLKEHFRCVPEIIGFSNGLSYDYKIKPLRDPSSSKLLPAVVNYRVSNGVKAHKENRKEAETIVALIKACMEQPEYAGKTFGVISLLGEEQARIIQSLIFDQIEVYEIENRKILSGIPSNFQGDARDVIFLSVVDSGTGNGPLPMQGFGVEDAFRKRYNVAASRARDQLWVVDSLDSSNDLKPNDIRKRLIDYSINPKAFENVVSEIDAKAESPFEAEVAKSLVSRGYHLVQQWKVGSYRLDMVAVCGPKTVAIECDGERYHSDETKISEDMERQTILERLGWRFIRVRGSDYYRNPEGTIDRVTLELKQKGILPESYNDNNLESDASRSNELLSRIKARANELVESYFNNLLSPINKDVIADALKDFTNNSSANSGNSIPHNRFESTPKSSNGFVKHGVPSLDASNQRCSANAKVNAETKKSSEKPQKAKSFYNNSGGKKIEQLTLNFKSSADAKRFESNRNENIDASNLTKSRLANTKQGRNKLDNENIIISKFHEMGLEIIDNREQSGIVWIIYSAEAKVFVEELLAKFKCKFGLEKRGSISTSNRAAWRINF